MSRTSDQATKIIDTSLEKALGDRYLSYALSTITARSLPDVRDGLKPVQRRILYAMRESGNTAEKTYRKSASAVGYVMMKYHPHGNDPIYEALVRLAQEFSTRYPLVDGQGNFGSIDGDNAAAMRYTEARMTKAAAAMLDGIDEDAVDFHDTYNAETVEPDVLPASFPNVLANGATGIAVGMATNIPPHNLGELCEAMLALIKNPQSSVEDLLHIVPGPDFPTGGIVVESPQSLRNTYATGRGSIRLRARYEVEQLKGGLYQIVVSEIPYQVQKARLIEKIAELLSEKRLPLLADVRDESTTDIRLVIIPKSRTVDPDVLMESLFRLTDLETRFAVNMNVLDEGRMPRVMNLKDILQAFLKHRRIVLQRRTQNRLNQIAHRIEILAGLRIAFLNLDEVIAIIRNEDDPKPVLMKRFELSDIQAEAILNTRLRSLRKLEEMELAKELEALQKEQSDLQNLLGQESSQWRAIAKEIAETNKAFGQGTPLGRRRTTFAEAPQLADVPLEAMVEREPVTILCSQKGWIRVLKGHGLNLDEQKYKEGDAAGFALTGWTTDKLLIMSSDGRVYTIGVDKLPGGRGFGEPLRLMIEMPNNNHVVNILVIANDQMETHYIVASSSGRGFMVQGRDLVAQTKNGRQVLNLDEGESAQIFLPIIGDHVAVVGQNRKMLVFPVSELPQMARGKGVKLQAYRDGGLSDLITLNLADGLSWATGSRTRTEPDLRPWMGKRAQSGRMVPVGFPRSGMFRG